MANNVVGIFSDNDLVGVLENLLEQAKTGKVTRLVTIYGNDEASGYAVVGLETLNDITEAIGNLEMIKTHLSLTILEDIYQGEE
jgi:hypothetical protein